MYGCETRKVTKGDEERLDAFLNKALRRILKIHWPMRISNEEIRQHANIPSMSEIVRSDGSGLDMHYAWKEMTSQELL